MARPKKQDEEQAITTVDTTTSTAIEQWEKEAQEEGKAEAAKITLTTSKLSFKNGDISMGDAKLANPLPVIIVGRAYENGYYPRKYNPDEPENPDCFAIADEEKDLVPSPMSVDKQHDGPCATCPHNQDFPRVCKNQIRLRVIAADTKPQDVATTPVLGASVPPTSLAGYKVYAKGIGAMGLPPWGFISEIQNEVYKTWFKLSFRPVQKVSGAMWGAIKARRPQIVEDMMKPYEPRTDGEAAPAPTKKSPGRTKKY
jgi:hypothetical protein